LRAGSRAYLSTVWSDNHFLLDHAERRTNRSLTGVLKEKLNSLGYVVRHSVCHSPLAYGIRSARHHYGSFVKIADLQVKL
jgi:hypothetical protein